MNLEHMEWVSCNCFKCADEWLRIRAFALLLEALENIAGYAVENVDTHTAAYNLDSAAKGKALFIINQLRQLK